MGLRFDPVGGGQFKQVVDTLIQIERQPIRDLEARKGREKAKVDLFNEFKGKVAGLRKSVDEMASFKRFVELKADLGDGKNLVDIQIDKDKAKPGSYTIEIEELAERSSMISNGFESKEEKDLGMGFIVVHKNDGDAFEVFVDEKDSSLSGIARLINEVEDSPVQATVVRDETDADRPWRLIMSSKKDGDASGVEFPDFYFLGGTQDLWVEDDHESRNALLKIDGFQMETGSNVIPDFIEGVTVNLKQARPGMPFTMTIRQDVEKITGKMEDLIGKVNEVLKFINAQNKVDESSDTSKTFAGDTGLQTIEYRLRNILHEGFPVGDVDTDSFRLAWLHQFGVTFEKDGSLKFNKEKFQTVVEKDFEGLTEAITGEFGFAKQTSELLKGFSDPFNGLLSMRDQALRDRIRRIDRQIGDQERRVDQRAKSLTDRFSRLQSTLGSLQQQQQYMNATLGGGGGGNLVTQLLG